MLDHQDGIDFAAFSPDGTKIFTTSIDRTIHIWNLVTSASTSGANKAHANPENLVPASKPVVFKDFPDDAVSAAFTSDGKQIAVASFDQTIRLYNVDGSGGPQRLEPDQSVRFTGTIGKRGAFSPDGRRVATITDDSMIRIWNVDGTSTPFTFRAPDLDAFSVAFSPDGTRLATASHRIRIPATSDTPERVEHVAKVWRNIRTIRNLNDPALWRATTWCPSVERRMQLLNLSKERAEAEYKRCLAKVAEISSVP